MLDWEGSEINIEDEAAQRVARVFAQDIQRHLRDYPTIRIRGFSCPDSDTVRIRINIEPSMRKHRFSAAVIALCLALISSARIRTQGQPAAAPRTLQGATQVGAAV